MKRLKIRQSRLIFLLLALVFVPTLASGVWFLRLAAQQRLDHAFMEAVKRQDTPTAIALLSRGADVSVVDRPYTPLTLNSLFSAIWNSLAGKKPLKETRNEWPYATGMTGLLWAAEQSDSNMVNVLLLHGANVNVQDDKGHTALCMATERGDLAVSTGTEIDIVRQLLNHGARVDMKDKNGGTIFDGIAQMERPDPEITRLLRNARSR